MRLLTVDSPEETPRLPPPGKVFCDLVFFVVALVAMVDDPSSFSSSLPEVCSSAELERGRFRAFAVDVVGAGDLDRALLTGLTFFSHVLRWSLNRAIVARASVT